MFAFVSSYYLLNWIFSHRPPSSPTQISTPLQISLQDFKEKINKSPLGPCLPKYQRLFHLGRELKSSKRSLEILKVGRFKNFILHLHSTQPTTLESPTAAAENDDDEIVVVQPPPARREKPVIEILEDDEDDEVEIVEGPMTTRSSKRQRRV